jgi:hypothetical protein
MSSQSNLPNSNSSIISFLILTIVYFIIEYVTKEKHSKIAAATYAVLLIGIQFAVNLSLTKELCGEPHLKTALIYTTIPWMLLFGILNIILIIFPGWLRPFSNTFGYFIVKALGKGDVLNSILKKTSDVSDVSGDLKNTLQQIYDNPFMLINEIPNPDDGIDQFVNQLSDMRYSNEIPDDTKDELRQVVRLKLIISKLIWFLLTGLLTISTSYNYIVQSKCSSSIEEMEKRHSEYLAKLSNDKTNKVEPRIYKDYGH